MHPRAVILGGLFLALLIWFAGAAPIIDKGNHSNSPQGIFLTARDAGKKKDYKAFLACFTEDSQKLMTGRYILLGAYFKEVSPYPREEKAVELAKLMDEVFRKHGLTDKVRAKDSPTNTSSKEGLKKIRAVADLVKSRSDYWMDYFAALEKIGHEPYQPYADSELADLKIEGDKARGTVVRKKGATERKSPLEFVREHGRWKLFVPDPKPVARPKAKSPVKGSKKS